VVCPPDIVASTSRRYEPTGVSYWQVEITNIGGQTSQSSTAAVRFWPPGTLQAHDTSVPVGPLAAGQTRVVFRVLFAVWSPQACADSAGQIPERDEGNNCT
jgi:hypothetical protein